jgi:hypothetical protein
VNEYPACLKLNPLPLRTDTFTALLFLCVLSIIAALIIPILKINKALKMEWPTVVIFTLILLGAAFLMLHIAGEISAAV